MNRSLLFILIIWLLPQYGHGQLNNTGANIVMTPGAYLVIDNLDFQNNGTFTQTAGTVKFSGSSNTLVAGSTAPQFYTIELDKTGASLQLQTHIGVNNQVLFTNGLLNLNNYNITLNAAALLNGENENSRITGTTGGYVQITNTLNAPVAANPGNLGIMITSAANLGSTVIRRGHTSQTNASGLGNSIFRYYDIIPSNNTALNATVGINYFNAELNGLDENIFTVWKSPATGYWINLGYDTRNTGANYVDKTGIADMARFTLSTDLNALPLTWGTFNTRCTNNGVTINFSTLNESNTNEFIIRRSSNGTNWQRIAAIPAAGNSSNTNTYSYTDEQSFSGAYYRIVQEDRDGHQTVSPVLQSNCSIADVVTVYPNPVYDNCRVSIETAASTPVLMQLYDHTGALVKQQTASVQAGISQMELSMAAMAHGVYSLVVSWGNGNVRTVKIVKL